MVKVGFLFGAGAEISYGMPTGGKFALEIFRRDASGAKKIFKENRDRVVDTSQYASNWLPEEYQSKKVTTFRESVYENIIKDTVTNNRSEIVRRINQFDEVAKSVLNNRGILIRDFREKVKLDLEKEYSEININQQLRYNDFFKEGNALFQSNYLAILLTYYKKYKFVREEEKELLGDIIKSTFQLHIGAMSETLSKNLQENIFSKDDIELDIFDDLGGNLSVNYQSAGVKGLELLSRSRPIDPHIIVDVAFDIIEQIYADVLDYKSVIDSNWHYLYTPKTEWGKFCNISIFLHSVHEYIEGTCTITDDNTGYYDDLSEQDTIEITTVATSNYVNNLIGQKLKDHEVIFLNGSLNEYYDPYMNTVISKEVFNNYSHFAVPLIFTQSGTKPMTSIDMSIKYVDFYNQLKQSDFICSIGFGFNIDDEHINGIIRTLIERDGKKLIIVDLDNSQDITDRSDALAKKLKVSNSEQIHYLLVNKERLVDGKKWSEYIVSKEFLSGIGVTND
ncbi:hypothetical protein [Streptococcus suis]|uniref:hypothetical protein n=1 Tax=Streptococcus suis TaxID=1307 RepID=UPI0004142092|nr:hypothetical protein [Streptococcus suis]MCL4935124.1 hypothetical protein [Streptococcus suis]MEE3745692.1 hypothetical protein [Streptococcus suis]